MFKRRPRSYSQIASDIVYPRGGWSRAFQYLARRMQRLPDQPHRIARGVAAGTFVNFTPFFGLHLFLGFALAWALRGNMLAAALGTLVGNPLTFPFIAMMSVGLGRWVLGVEGSMSPGAILSAFTSAGRQLMHNFLSIFDERIARWDHLLAFYDTIFLPFLVGGFIPGLIAATVAHFLTVRVVEAYHRRRALRTARRAERAVRKGDARR